MVIGSDMRGPIAAIVRSAKSRYAARHDAPFFLALPMLVVATSGPRDRRLRLPHRWPRHIRLAIVTGHGVAPPSPRFAWSPATVILDRGRGRGRSSCAQSWFDDEGLRLDLVEAQARNYVARLRAILHHPGADPVSTSTTAIIAFG